MLDKDDLGKYVCLDTLSLVSQVFDNPGTVLMKTSFQNLMKLLAQVANRAIQLDDPELNALMIRLNLYEIPPEEHCKKLEEQYARMSKE